MSVQGSSTSSTFDTNYYVRHCDPNTTGEGLGSHARGTIYPLLRVSLKFGWKILWQPSELPCWSAKGNTTRPEYQNDLQGLGEWLFGTDEMECYEDWDKNSLAVVNIDLNNDPRLGRILGSTNILIDSIQEYLNEKGADNFYCQTFCATKSRRILISLNGRFQYQDDPTPEVIQWMQQRCLKWKDGERTKPKPPKLLRIVAHIRVPEDYCSQEWKDGNSIHHVLATVRIVKPKLDQLLEAATGENSVTISLDVYTEACFPATDEETLRQELDSMNLPLALHRQTPLLPTVQGMATADLLIPASSFLSSFAAFFQTSWIVLPDEKTRRDKYFLPHLRYCKTIEIMKHDKNNKLVPHGHNPTQLSDPLCKIVQVEEEDTLEQAMMVLVKSI